MFIFFADKCDQIIHCVDKSDESNCFCNKNEFQCQCYKNKPVDCKFNSFAKDFTGCIPKEQYHDNITQCPDGSDESQFTRNVLCGDFNVTITRLSNLTENDLINFASYNNSSCHNVSSLQCDIDNCNKTDLICMSTCHNDTLKRNRSFQCNDGSLGLAFQFCNGNIDCPDKSDEIEDEVGFKCVGFKSTRKCVLPQRNLHDDVAQCSDESDLCRNNNSCFQCFDRRLMISSKQVCDDVFDCYDWSDECLCKVNLNKQSCKDRFSFSCLPSTTIDEEENNYTTCTSNFTRSISVNYDKTKSTKLCKTRRKEQYIATLCDGRPECSDLSDECDCENPPEFCNDACHDILYVGDRYCDGIEDEFYKIINKSNCLKGFDEIHCPKRFYCKNGNKISIDQNYVCNGKVDCDDESDEIDCKTENKKVFSSETEMIASPVLKGCFWIIGMIVITENLYVIFTTTRSLHAKKFTQSYKFQKIIIINILIADFIMGVYLLTIAIYSTYYSGYYFKFDYQWRSSLSCSIIGSLTVVSTEASCLFMVILTSSRLYTIYNPLSVSPLPLDLKSIVVSIWLLSFTLALLPMFDITSWIFVHNVVFSNQFNLSEIWDESSILQLAYRFARLTNKSIENHCRNMKSALQFLKNNHPEYSPKHEFGYYGETSVCMPRFYVKQGDNGWEYSLAIILVNFLSFLFIAISYVLIYKHSTKNQIRKSTRQRAKEDKTIQTRITRIILTDFMCCIPICVLSFLKLGNVELDNIVYILSAVLLLPINSAINPFLYSPMLDIISGLFKAKLKTKIKNFTENLTLNS